MNHIKAIIKQCFLRIHSSKFWWCVRELYVRMHEFSAVISNNIYYKFIFFLKTPKYRDHLWSNLSQWYSISYYPKTPNHWTNNSQESRPLVALLSYSRLEVKSSINKTMVFFLNISKYKIPLINTYVHLLL